MAAGARVHDLTEAAAVGDVAGFLGSDTAEPEKVAALRMAAGHGRLPVIHELLAAGTPVDGTDQDGSTALHEAAFCGRLDSVECLLARGADPARQDTRFVSTPLGWCRHQRDEVGPGRGHDQVELLLAPLTDRITS